MNSLNKTIVFLINDITALGGTERMCSIVANKLSAMGFNVVIASLYETQPAPFFSLSSDVKRIQLFQEQNNKLNHVKLPFVIYKTVKTLKADIIISCDTQMCLSSSIPLMNKKHIAWEHFNSSIVTRFGSRWFGRRLASLFCKKVIVLTKSDKENWIKTLHTEANKISVIPNPLSIDPKKSKKKGKRKKIVLAVGRMTSQKGFDLLIHAWTKIDKETRKNWKLKIVGPRGSAKPHLENLIHAYQISHEVELAAESLRIENEYQESSIYVLSSRYEGFGLTLLEAMGQGLPVIAFDCPMGPKEIIADKYGKLIPPNNVPQLTKAMNQFMTKPKLRNKYGSLARKRSQEYSAKNIMNLWQTVIHQV